MTVGIDEVGRGAWAGPLCVGAVALGDSTIIGLTDSKKLTAKRREQLNREIRRTAAAVGLGWVSAKKIDEIGLSSALKLAAQRAMAQIRIEYDHIIIDGTIRLIDDQRVVTMKQADVLVPCVSAASIVAKVARDAYMRVMATSFVDYGFESHVGYGTAVHTAALAKLGPSLIHRLSFAPLKQSTVSQPKTHVETAGEHAEAMATIYLKKQGYRIIDRNWKTKWCEIDIIAQKKGVTHFVEVKYRHKDATGKGLTAITPKKLRQMKFAAELWLSGKNIDQAVLSAIEVGGDEFTISQFVEVV